MPISAAFTLIFPLPQSPEIRSGREWVDWSELTKPTAPEPLRTAQASRGTESPHRVVPTLEQPYFQSHITSALYPTPLEHMPGARQLVAPRNETLTITGRGASTTLSVDLLEYYAPRLQPQLQFGLVHMSPDAGALEARELLETVAALRMLYRRRPKNDVQLSASSRSPRRRIPGNWPVRHWIEHLFGGEQAGLERMLYVLTAAGQPDTDTLNTLPGAPKQSIELELLWQEALARGRLTLEPGALQVRGGRGAVRFGPFAGYVLGRGASLVAPHASLEADVVRNVRSYWAEALLLGLAQHRYLEEFAENLGALGVDPATSHLDRIHDRWLAFRNTLWWSDPSTRDVPRLLLGTLRRDLGSKDLFGELAGDFDTYLAKRQRDSADRQASALITLQRIAVAAGLLAVAIALLSLLIA